MSLVSLNNLSFIPPGAEAPLWHSLNLNIQAGERILITGHSGVGKSTLLHIMAGLIPKLSSGKLKGWVNLTYKQSALVLQNPETQSITPSVFEEITFALENRAWPELEIRKRADEVLELFNLHPLANRNPTSLSGGEAQHLALACAFAQDPDILFLDEPTAYLDPWSSQQFFDILSRILSNRTLVLIDHQPSYAQPLINRAIQLTSSTLIELDPKTACHPFYLSTEAHDDLHFIPTPKEQVSLKISQLTHAYPNSSPLFSPLNAEFFPGRISAIVGPSGAGKTTLLKKMMGLLPIKPGSLFYGKKEASQMSRKERFHLLLYVPQNSEHFFLRMHAAEEWKLSHAEADQIELAARLFNLDPHSHLNIFNMSEGEKRRLNLGLVFLDARPIVLIDEPTIGLDQSAFTALVQGLKLLRSQGRTVILVTHSAALVQACVDDAWFLSQAGLSACHPKTYCHEAEFVSP